MRKWQENKNCVTIDCPLPSLAQERYVTVAKVITVTTMQQEK